MKNFITIAAFAAGTNALVGRSDSCCFHLTSSGGASGQLGQLSDGQNRIGDNSLSPAQYCIDSKGAITDSNGRGCILTPPTTQFQCDEGASPTTGFSVSSQGELEYNGSKDFVACATGQNGGLNVYTNPTKSDVTGCVNVELTADSCSSPGSGSGSSSSSTSAVPSSFGSSSSQSTPSAPASSAPVPQTTSVSSAPATEPTPSSGSSTPSESPLPGSPVTVVNTITVTDCSCSATAPGGGGGSGGGSAEQPSPSTSAPAPSGSGGTAPSESAPPAPSSTGGGSGSQPSGSDSASVPASSASATPSTTGSSSGSCPTTLTTGSYEYPHLIVPVDSSSPDTAAGTSYNGTVSSTISSAFNFDIPSSDSGKTCSLVFLFPKLQDLETSSYSFSGDGKIDFAKLSSAVDKSTTFKNLPSVSQDLGEITVSPGNSYVISTFSCPAGETVAYEMKNSGSTDLNFFEDYNPSPLGLYITTC
ncbi:Ubiquitin 3 binding protein But2, C-terminal [Penicillium italicum]|uniref:Ubiquitin 3 binding protein But2, C-terminal n=1 Tax=Penicillium italicum TaxID=40296 RepID=A0A0A2KA59_PENIT|nr:Ubiquitin 3 binding protein But2, C-terminal [Penicillium italicum]